MGIAQVHRGDAAISRQIDDNRRPVEFEIMDRLNEIEKAQDALRPFGPIVFVEGSGGYWAECQTTGYGYWYANLRTAVANWRVIIIGYEHGQWRAVPDP